MEGYANFINFMNYASWAVSPSGSAWYHDLVCQDRGDRDIRKAAMEMYDQRSCQVTLVELHAHEEYIEKTGGEYSLLYVKDGCALIQSGEDRFVVPERMLTVRRLSDRSGESFGSMARTIAGKDGADAPGLEVLEDTATLQEYRGKLADNAGQIQKVLDEAEAVRKRKEEEVEAFRRELDKKYAGQVAELEEQKALMEAKKAELERRMYFLETQIYAVQCFLGETVRFVKLCSGRRAPRLSFLVVNQKFRFLDEELGKYFALSEVDGDDAGLFEDILKNREDIRELFCPTEKGISFVRISREGIGYAASDQVANVLKTYRKFRGKMTAVLVRDGENLYIGWADEEKISVSGEKVFNRPGTSVSYSSLDDEKEMERVDPESTEKDMVSRYFLYAILQGLLKRGDIISVPRGSEMGLSSSLVRFASGEGGIEEKRYPPLTDLIAKYSAPAEKGDMVLTLLRVTRDDLYRSTRNMSYNNNRGRGERNLTHDVSIPDCSVKQINLVTHEYAATVLCRCSEEKEETKHTCELPRKMDPEEALQYIASKTWDFSEKYSRSLQKRIRRYPVSVSEVSDTPHCYISCVKEYCRGQYDSTVKKARANLEVFSDEYINLTFLNSVWVAYAISHQNIGTIQAGNKDIDSYAHLIKYLQKALDFLKKREEEEAELLGAYIDVGACPEWPVYLSEWKFGQGIHAVNKRNARKAAGYIVWRMS